MSQYHKKFTANIAMNQSDSTAVPISGFDNFAVEVPAFSAMDSATCEVSLKACDTLDGTYKTYMFRESNADSTVIFGPSSGNMIIAVGPSAQLPPYVKVCLDTTATAAAGLTAYIHANRNI